MNDFTQKKTLPFYSLAALLLTMMPTCGQAAELAVPGEFASIQAAIDAAEPGDTVVVAAGSYREQIRVAAGIQVRSDGDSKAGEVGLARAETTIVDAGGKAPAVILEEGSILDGLTVTGAGSFDQESFDRHHAERGENLADAHGAVGLEGGNSAISVDGVSATVRHCIVHDNGFPGIALSGAGNRSEILQNRVYRNMGGGIGIANGARARVAENRCWQNLRAGIGCRNASPIIENNHSYNNVRAGIGIREGATPLVRGNECYNNQRAGIGVRMPGTEPQLHGNRCYENGMAGIGCRVEAAPFIVGNECFGNRLAGIGAMTNARPTIVANRIYDNKAAAIGLEACDSGEALIRGNDITATTLVCLAVQGGWRVSVEDNSISREGGMPPLVMVFKGARADFTGNTFTGSGVAAIRSQGQIFVSDNRFDCPAPRKGGPPQNAVWALPESMLSMTDDNLIEGWREPENPAIRVATRQELQAALNDAVAGQTILIAPGEYDGGISVRDLQGSAGQPIVIAGAKRDDPPVFKGGGSGMHLIAPANVELRHLVLSGARTNGLNIDDGGSSETPAQGVKLSGLVVRDAGAEGNEDGIKLSGLRDFRVEGCRIEHWGNRGSGIDMVGCHDGIIFDSDFTHDGESEIANGVQAKGGSHNITVRRCRFDKVGGRGVNLGGSTGADYFRPTDAKHEASEITVEDCTFQGSMAPVAFVGADKGRVRYNTLLRPTRWIARILQENTTEGFIPCRNGRFENNRVEFRSDELRTAVNVGANTEPESFRFTDNTWICLDQPEAGSRLIQLPVESTGDIHGEGQAPHTSGVRPISPDR